MWKWLYWNVYEKNNALQAESNCKGKFTSEWVPTCTFWYPHSCNYWLIHVYTRPDLGRNHTSREMTANVDMFSSIPFGLSWLGITFGSCVLKSRMDLAISRCTLRVIRYIYPAIGAGVPDVRQKIETGSINRMDIAYKSPFAWPAHDTYSNSQNIKRLVKKVFYALQTLKSWLPFKSDHFL